MVLMSALRSCLTDRLLSSPLTTKADDNDLATTTSGMAVIEFRDPFFLNGIQLSNANSNDDDKSLTQKDRKFRGSVISANSSDYVFPQVYDGPDSDMELNTDTPLTNFPRNYQLLKTLLLKKLGINVNNEKSVFELQNYKKNKSQVKITVLNSSDTVYLPLRKITCKQFRFLPTSAFDYLDYTTRYGVINPVLLNGIPQTYLSPSLDDYDDGDNNSNAYNPEQLDCSSIEQDKGHNSENSTKLHTFVVVLSTPCNQSEMPFCEFQFKLSLNCKLSTQGHKNSQDSEIKKDRFFDEFAVSELIQSIELREFNYFIPSENLQNCPRNPKRFDSIYSNATSESEIRSFTSSDSKTSSVFSKDDVEKILMNSEESTDCMNKVIFGKNLSLPVRTFYKDSILNKNVSHQKDKFKAVDKFPAGDYVFVIPVKFDSSIPETIVVPNGNLQCNVSISYEQLSNCVPFHKKGKDSLNNIIKRIILSVPTNDVVDVKGDSCSETFHLRRNLTYDETQKTNIKNTDKNNSKIDESQQYTQVKNYFNLPLVRGSPPADFEFNKSIIISKTFRNYFNYDIFIPRKYIPLNTEIPISIRFVPYTKEVQITSVKINVVERIYYKKRSHEDYFLKTFTVPLESLRNEASGSTALREYIFDNGNLRNTSYPYGINLDKEIVMKLPVFFSGIDSAGSQFCKDPKVKVSAMKKLIHSLGMNNSENYYPHAEKKNISEYAPQSDQILSKNGNILKTSERRLSNALRLLYENRNNNNSFGNILSKEEEENKKLPLDYQTQKKGLDLLKQEALISKAAITYGDEEYSSRRKLYKCEDGQINFEYLNESIPTLHPDSISFESIKVNHSLQVCIKASHCKKVENFGLKRKKNKDKQTKHTKYAIFIDTGIVLLSSLCEHENIQLPKYKAQDEKSMLTNRNEMVRFGEKNADLDCKCERLNSKGQQLRKSSFSKTKLAKNHHNKDGETYSGFDKVNFLPRYNDIV